MSWSWVRKVEGGEITTYSLSLTVTESEWGDASSVAGQGSAALAHLTPSTPFWLPYALILVSEAPVYVGFSSISSS